MLLVLMFPPLSSSDGTFLESPWWVNQGSPYFDHCSSPALQCLCREAALAEFAPHEKSRSDLQSILGKRLFEF